MGKLRDAVKALGKVGVKAMHKDNSLAPSPGAFQGRVCNIGTKLVT
jgi:hypothetical protein